MDQEGTRTEEEEMGASVMEQNAPRRWTIYSHNGLWQIQTMKTGRKCEAEREMECTPGFPSQWNEHRKGLERWHDK